MCGIVGFKSSKRIEDEQLKTLLALMKHRGPDHSSQIRKGDFQAGYTRLEIVGRSEGQQPFQSASKRVTGFFNGELYNWKELRARLKEEGVKGEVETEGEVIANLFEVFGVAAFAELDGMFAIALWDEGKRCLYLARDLAGEKPLYFSKFGLSEVMFASELTPFRHFGRSSLNPQAIRDFFTFHWVPEPDTILQGVHCVPPGTVLQADEFGLRYLPIENVYSKDFWELTDEEAIEHARSVVIESVEARLQGDVPFGSFLSGGVDSSLVTMLALRAGKSLQAFSVGFESIHDALHDSSYDESLFARKIAQKFGCDHHRLLMGSKEFSRALDMLSAVDQPFANPAALGVLLVGEKAKSLGIKVLLSGDGSDEAFGGYPWHRYAEEIERLSYTSEAAFAGDLSFADVNIPFETRLKHLAYLKAPQRASLFQYVASEPLKTKILHPDLLGSTVGSFRWFQSIREGSVDEFLHFDRVFFSHNENLRRSDLMLMRHSVEGRAPFASREILALSEKLSYRQKVRDGMVKFVLKEAFKGELPEEILSRPKHGFTLPIDHWLREDHSFLVQEAINRGSRLHELGIFSPGVGEQIKTVQEGPKKYWLLYSFVVMENWLRKQGF